MTVHKPSAKYLSTGSTFGGMNPPYSLGLAPVGAEPRSFAEVKIDLDLKEINCAAFLNIFYD
eukprot:snap_masked-scaffold_1-processed-gene-11.30-mRNA-1 protein AED:1.00 eAED:1.00 QI:0/-1/0/0/-1/1/1/0/61